ncbi:MAG: calcineurin-like phosphoesterase C-terminal domain-containing protein [Mangrovibacterium sp.]
MADPQVKTGADYTRLQTETIPDIKEEATKHNVCYGITLGDIVFDTPDMMNSMKSLFPTSGVKFFHVIGNHDHYQETTNDADAIKNYENCFGPTNYSFNRGNAHIIVMDDVIYTAKQAYTGGFTADQISWLKSDLQYVPKNKLVIVCVHIPIRNQSSISRYREFYSALAGYNEVHIMSGHTHYNQNMVVDAGGHEIYEHVQGAACGAWWTCTINSDGTPNGYGVYEIRDNKIENWFYKPAKYDDHFQIRMYPAYSFNDNSGHIIANVWNSDDSWKVELFEDGVKTGDMVRYTDYEKCAYQFFKSLGKAEPTTTNGVTDWFRRPDHLYRLVPRSSTSFIEIKVTDRFGTVYTQDHFTTSVEEVRTYYF